MLHTSNVSAPAVNNADQAGFWPFSSTSRNSCGLQTRRQVFIQRLASCSTVPCPSKTCGRRRSRCAPWWCKQDVRAILWGQLFRKFLNEASNRAGEVCAGMGTTARQRGTGGSVTSSPDSRAHAQTAATTNFSSTKLQTLTSGASYPSSRGACHCL